MTGAEPHAAQEMVSVTIVTANAFSLMANWEHLIDVARGYGFSAVYEATFSLEAGLLADGAVSDEADAERFVAFLNDAGVEARLVSLELHDLETPGGSE